MTNDQNLTWVEWVEADTFLSADSGGHIQLHHFDLAKLTKKISKGKYEDKDEAKRSYDEHVPFGVYQVSYLVTLQSSNRPVLSSFSGASEAKF